MQIVGSPAKWITPILVLMTDGSLLIGVVMKEKL
jgi:hypothetical protein